MAELGLKLELVRAADRVGSCQRIVHRGRVSCPDAQTR